MTTLELLNYYVKLLILQYAGKPKAKGTIAAVVAPVLMPQTSVQVLTFSAAPTAGLFTLSYDDVFPPSPFNWDDSSATIQAGLRTITGLGAVLVTGEIADGALTVTFVGVSGIALPLVVDSSTLVATADPVTIAAAETDLTLPLAVQGAFNLTGDAPAAGVQLDIIGEYVGVTRTGPGFTRQITLGDADFVSLIKMAIVQNYASSSLFAIQQLLNQFFPGEVFVFDYKNMSLSYLIASTVGTQELVQLFVTERILPQPMGVRVSVIYIPIAGFFFGFRTYALPAVNSTPFNSYAAYNTSWRWFSYADVIPF